MRDPMDVFDAADEGLAWGEREGGRIRDARAYRTGGLDAVADAAGRTGDLTRYGAVREEQRTARRFDDERTQAAYERMETIAPWVRNIIRGTRDLDPERRRAALSQPQYVQRFLDFGFSQEQVNQGIEGLSNPDAAIRQQVEQELETAFTQHQNPEFRITDPATGAIGAIDQQAGRYIEGAGRAPPQQPEWQAGHDRAYRIMPDGRTELGGAIPHAPRGGAGGGGGGRAPSGYRFTEDGELEPIPGGPHAPGVADRQTRDRVRGLRELESALMQYSNAIDDYEPGIPEAFGLGGAASEIDAAAQILATQLNRSAFELGALAGPDYQIIVDSMGDPTNWTNLLRGGGAQLRARLATVMQMVRNKRAEQERELQIQGIDPAVVMGQSALAPAGDSPSPPTPEQARAELARRRAAAARGGGG